MRKIGQLIFRIFLIFVILSPMFYPLTVEAKKSVTIKDMRAALQELKNKKAQYESQKQQTQAQINAARQSILNAEKEKDQIAKDIEAAKAKVTESENEIAKLEKDTEAILRYYQLTKGDNVFSEYLSDATSLKDLIRRLAAVEQITNYANESIHKLEDLIEEKEKLQIELANKNDELDQKIVEVSDKMEELKGNYSAINEINLDINEQIKNQEEQIKFYKAICSSEDIPIDSCAQEVVSYGWLRPTISGGITSPFGPRSTDYHYGVDIGNNPEGTPVYAPAAGRISLIVYRSSCGGNQVYMHSTVNGQRYTINFSHLLRVNVEHNQIVTTDTIIGYVGGGSTASHNGGYDRCTSGPHLHYQVAKGYYGVDYSAWSKFLANSIIPPAIPNNGAYGTKWYKR